MGSQKALRYADERNRLLNAIKQSLLTNQRIVAAWLTGSMARGDDDEFSDIDISVVVSDEHIRLAGDWQEFLRQFGKPANIHEAKQNAPEGGTMASTLYRNGITIDWMLMPKKAAARPKISRLLLEKEPIRNEPDPVKPPPEEIQKQLEDRVSYFWMMAAVAAKSLLRNHGVRFHIFFNILFWTKEEIIELLSSEAIPYRKYSGLTLQMTQDEQANALMELCNEVARLDQRSSEPALQTIENLLALRSAYSQS